MPGLPIPDDFNDEWSCIQLQWPNTVKYRAVLRGLIYSLTRGRTYDEQTGTVIDAQSIGREIFNRNNPFLKCALGTGDSDGGGYEASGTIWGCDGDCDCDNDCGECGEMSGCCLRWNSGKLQILTCGEWVDVPGDVGGIGGGGIPESDIDWPNGEVPWDNEPDEGQTLDFSCPKATAIVKLLVAGLLKLDDIWDDLDKWNYIGKMEDAIGYNCNNTFLLGALNTYAQGRLVVQVDMDDFSTDEDKQQQIVCKLADRLDATTPRVTESDWNVIKQIPGWTDTDLMEESVIMNIIAAIGRSNFEKSSIASANGDFDCACPEPPQELIDIPMTYDWAHYYDFTTGQQNWSLFNSDGGRAYEAGVGFTNRNMLRYEQLPNVLRKPAVGGGVIRYVFMQVQWPTSSSWAACKVFEHQAYNIAGEPYYGQANIGVLVQTTLNVAYDLSCWIGQATQVGASGDAIISGLLIAGTGNDPFPADPQYGL